MQSGAGVGAEIAPDKAEEAVGPPLPHVLLFVAQQARTPGGRPPDRDHPADGDGVGAGGNGAADPPPMVAVALEGHGDLCQ